MTEQQLRAAVEKAVAAAIRSGAASGRVVVVVKTPSKPTQSSQR